MIKRYALPAGEKGGPYAVNVDGSGIVWANEIETDTVVRLDPSTGDLKVVLLPSRGLKIRKMAIDAQGRLWYMGSANGRLRRGRVASRGRAGKPGGLVGAVTR